ncbi:MAG: redoxin domain-containing protein [Candidatus Zixiibacteriota bacterium]|nr:MAG: redoxin domain-containing protein [candidate division Zixibacteria bacterium]
MSEKQSIGVKSAILYGIAIIVVAFIGVVLGNWFVEWRRSSQMPPRPELKDWQMANRSSLEFNDPFPSEELLDLDSNTVSIDSLIAGRKVLVVMISPGCQPCAMAIKSWRSQLETLPADFTLLAIAGDEIAEMRTYRDEHNVPFPIYCDPAMLYTQQYDLTTFPTVIGVNEEGNVALVWHGFGEKYTLTDFYDVISGPNPQG